MSYTDPNLALDALKNLPAVRGYTAPADDQFLNNLLAASAGVLNGAIYYRIYYVAAKFLSQPASIHVLSQAEDSVKFTGLAVPIASLLDLQLAEDRAIGYEIPLGYEIQSPEPNKCLPLFGSGSYRYTIKL